MKTKEQKELNKLVADNYINGKCNKCAYFTGFAMKGGNCHWNGCSPKEILNEKTNAIKCDFNAG